MTLDYDVFVNVPKLDRDPKTVQRLYDFKDFDFRLRPGSAAIDRGVTLANINDGFSGEGAGSRCARSRAAAADLRPRRTEQADDRAVIPSNRLDEVTYRCLHIMNRREALAALASTAALPLLSGCNSDTPADPRPRSPTPRRTRWRCSIRSPRITSASHQSWRPRSASTPAPGPGCDRSSPIDRWRASRTSRTRCARISSAPRPSIPPRSITPRAPAWRWCEARIRPRSKDSRCRTATSPSAAGATLRTW